MSFKNIHAEEFAALTDKTDHVVLDVRSPQELSDGSIPGHQMINFFDSDFRDRISHLDKSKHYLVYCRSGNRSGQTCQIMSTLGFTGSLYNLVGGIGAWNALQEKS